MKKDKEKKKRSASSIVVTIILLVICVVLLVAVVFKMFQVKNNSAAFSGNRRTDLVENVKASNIYVKEIEPETYTKTLQFFATVVDEGSIVPLVTKTSGYVSEILVEEEDEVKEGDIIGYIDPSQPGATYKASPISARISGVIKSIPVSIGQFVPAGSVFANEKPEVDYTVTVSVPERYIDNLEVGKKATITSTIRSELNTSASISEIADKINPGTRTINVKLKPESFDYFLDGLSVTANLNLEEINDAFVVPNKAITNIGGIAYVYIVEDGKAKQVAIETGSSNDRDTLVLSGLRRGDKVVVEGTVGEGTAVNILER